ncbi:MAG: phosphotransferase [Gammaproteobacteria bacterium]
MNEADQRRYALESWAIEQLCRLSPELSGTGQEPTFSTVSGDASFRRYFRLTQKENNSAFVRITELLRRHDVTVPEVLSFDLNQGFLLVTDLGDALFLNRVNAENAADHYHQALTLLSDIQGVPHIELSFLPRYTADVLQQEMDLFEAWFLPQYLQITPGPTTLTLLQTLYGKLVDSALSQPQVLVHRDYHSRNLMWRNQTLVPIDYQDALLGPITYDVVSLLRDSYVRWPRQQVQAWLMHYADRVAALGFCERPTNDVWLQWVDWMGLQRQIKICGVFARLYLRDGKTNYLQNIPLTVRYLLEVSIRYPETQPFAHFLEDQVLPALYRVSPEARAVIEARVVED